MKSRTALTESSLATSAEGPPPSKPLGEFLAESPNPVPSLLGEGLMPIGGMILLSGEGGVGKSSLAVQLALSLAGALPAFAGFPIPGGATVLYVQREGNRDSFRARVSVAAGALGTPDARVSISAPPDSRRIAGWPELQTEIERVEVDLAIIDTISRFALFDENSSRDWKERVFLPAEKVAAATRCALLFLHHWGKPAENRDGRQRVRGTSAMVDDVDTAIRLGRGSSADLRILEFDKVRCGAEPDPVKLRFDRERAIFSSVSPDEAAAIAAERDDRDLDSYCGKISAALEKEARACKSEGRPFRGLPGRDLAKLKGCGEREATNARDHMVEIGTLVRLPGPRAGWFRYRLASQAEESV